MPKFSVPLRLHLSLITVVGAALLEYGDWFYLSMYAVISVLWVIGLQVAIENLIKLLGVELIFLTFLVLPMGWEKASFLLIRSLICLLIMNSFVLTLPPHSFGIALKGLPLPVAFKEILLLAGQYIEILVGEVQRMQRAAQMRGLGGANSWLRYTNAAMIGSLYLRSLNRAERVYSAMEIKGYKGNFPLDSSFKTSDYLVVLVMITTTMVITIASYLD
ncbi:Transmembrane component NikQ of energizing module of nickel ECF transporter [Richelia intracellularis HM01]|uniref:energy-coupling factor transporter transmembrane component T family protein n=1 Tax=Richelia intracellularis TaxID=1164990 RepID=UPI0002B5EE83|nr:energy-coupling factor transporter transmembrane component T [Richelia intracellularis]CCH66075.1 Transmembrane component NikQ of energizing module of nickel ECF transporter [Richelia intracellularis HM01]